MTLEEMPVSVAVREALPMKAVWKSLYTMRPSSSTPHRLKAESIWSLVRSSPPSSILIAI